MAMDEVGAKLSLKNRQAFSRDAKKAKDDVQDIGTAAERAGKRAGDAAVGFARLSNRGISVGVGAISTGLRTATVAAGALAVGIGALSVKAIGLASDANETRTAFETVFAGAPLAQVDKFVNDLSNASGIARAELQDAARQFGVFAKAAGLPDDTLADFSTGLTQAGLDLASFYNVDPGEALQALQSGLAGEAEPLRRFGIFLSDASLGAFALEQGINKTTGEMTEQEKVALRQAFILKNLGDANGDLARTQEGPANQMRRISGLGKELMTTFGKGLLPAVEVLAPAFGDLLAGGLDRVNGLLPTMQTHVRDAAEGLLSFINTLRTGFTEDEGTAIERVALRLRDVYEAARNLDVLSAEGQNAIVGMFPPEVEGIIRGLFGVVEDVVTVLTQGLVPGMTDAGDTVPLFLSPIGLLREALGWAADNTDTVRVAVTVLLPIMGAAKIATLGWGTATGVASAAQAVFTGVLNTARFAYGLFRGAQLASTASAAAQRGAMMALRLQIIAGTVASGIARAATVTWTGAQWLLNAALSANPIGLVIAAIALLAAGVVVAYKKSETFRGIVDGVWEALKDAWRWAGKFLDRLTSFELPGWITSIGEALGGIGGTISGLFGGGGDGLGIGGGGAAMPLRPGAGYRAQLAAVAGSGLPYTVMSTFRRGSRTRSGNLSYHASGRAVDLGGTPGQMLALNHWLAKNYGSITKELILNVPGAINLLNGRPHRYSAGVMSDHTDHNHFALERGGPFRAGRTYLYGERGPELGIFPAAGHMLPADVTHRVLSSARATGGDGVGMNVGSTEVTNHIYVQQLPGESADELAQRIVVEMDRAVQRASTKR